MVKSSSICKFTSAILARSFLSTILFKNPSRHERLTTLPFDLNNGNTALQKLNVIEVNHVLSIET